MALQELVQIGIPQPQNSIFDRGFPYRGPTCQSVNTLHVRQGESSSKKLSYPLAGYLKILHDQLGVLRRARQIYTRSAALHQQTSDR